MQQAVCKAILDSLGEDGQKQVIQEAVNSLLEKADKNNYRSDAPTRLQQVFKDQVQFAAQGVVREILANDEEFQAKLKSMVYGMVKSMTEHESLQEKLGEVVVRAIERLVVKYDGGY